MPLERITGSTVDILDRILDKGIVIDATVHVSLIGIHGVLSVEARVIVASIDTYSAKWDSSMTKRAEPDMARYVDEPGAITSSPPSARPRIAPAAPPAGPLPESAARRTGTSRSNMAISTAQAIQSALRAWNAHDPRRYAALLDDSYVGETHAVPMPLRGREAARRAMRMKLKLFRDLHFDIHGVITKGDEAFVSWIATGTRGTEPVNVSGCTVGDLKRGKIVRTWCYWDTDEMLAPLRVLSGRGNDGPSSVHRRHAAG